LGNFFPDFIKEIAKRFRVGLASRVAGLAVVVVDDLLIISVDRNIHVDASDTGRGFTRAFVLTVGVVVFIVRSGVVPRCVVGRGWVWSHLGDQPVKPSQSGFR